MGKIAILFAGQGAQYPGMGKDIYETNSAAHDIFELGESLTPGIKDICFNSDASLLSKTENTQPALFLTDLACAYALREIGIAADCVAGFSLGEICALAYSKILSDNDAYRLVCHRGQLMSKCAEEHPGAMAAVLKLPAEQVEEICSEFNEVYPVNYNCPGQIAVAGNKSEMPRFIEIIKSAGGRAVPLAVSGAFHSPYMKQASEGLLKHLENVNINTPSIPLYANLTALPYSPEYSDIKNTISRQASSSVKFEQTIKNMYSDGVDTFIEVGAGKTLSGFVSRTLKDVKILNVGDSAGLKSAAENLL